MPSAFFHIDWKIHHICGMYDSFWRTTFGTYLCKVQAYRRYRQNLESKSNSFVETWPPRRSAIEACFDNQNASLLGWEKGLYSLDFGGAHFLQKSGKASNGAELSFSFKTAKACSCSFPHLKPTFFLAISVRGAAIEEKFGTNLL